jgi:hypothetical protein
MKDDVLKLKVERAKELLATANHAAMATVNEDGSPHNTPYFFLIDTSREYLYWSSFPNSMHSRNLERTGQLFVVLYDAMESGGLYIRADDAHISAGDKLNVALQIHNEKRLKNGKDVLQSEYFQGDSPQRMYVATIRQFWVNGTERGADGNVTRDLRTEVMREYLLAS